MLTVVVDRKAQVYSLLSEVCLIYKKQLPWLFLIGYRPIFLCFSFFHAIVPFSFNYIFIYSEE